MRCVNIIKFPAVQEVGLSKPIDLRFKGTNADKAKKMIEGKSI